MYTTVYTETSHCDRAEDIVSVLRSAGLGLSVVADECQKIASVQGPRAELYRQAVGLAKGIRYDKSRRCNVVRPG